VDRLCRRETQDTHRVGSRAGQRTVRIATGRVDSRRPACGWPLLCISFLLNGFSPMGYDSRRFVGGTTPPTVNRTPSLSTRIKPQQLPDPFLAQDVLRAGDRSVQREHLDLLQRNGVGHRRIRQRLARNSHPGPGGDVAHLSSRRNLATASATASYRLAAETSTMCSMPSASR
jgi:hypothetical protein